jgi:rare lipoprotein A
MTSTRQTTPSARHLATVFVCFAVAACAPRVTVRGVSDEAEGLASYYARSLEGRRTASGEPYRGAAMTAAHRTLPFGSCLIVRSEETGRSTRVLVNDRGPFVRNRIIDVSHAAAVELGMIERGVIRVRIGPCR